MPRHQETRILPYKPAEIFDLVADIEAYPDFLPWCQQAHIIETAKGDREDNVVADLVVGNNFFSETFRSYVTLRRPERIEVAYGGGALKHLETVWAFDETPNGACQVSFQVDFEINSRLMGALMDAFFDKAFSRMVQAFEGRALNLYDKKAALECNRRL